MLGALAITAPLVACSSTPDEVDPTPTPSATTTGTTPPASCGAQGPSKCALGATCQTAADCESTSCQGGKCVASSCTNGQQDGTETGVDCGGTCSKKCDGEPCTKGEDCKSTTCSPQGTCAPAGSKTCGVGLPVTCKNGAYSIVKNLPIDEFSRGKMDASHQELREERDGVKELI